MASKRFEDRIDGQEGQAEVYGLSRQRPIERIAMVCLKGARLLGLRKR